MFNAFSRAFVPGFRVEPEIPGFNVRPPDAEPGFNVDEDSVPRRETWSDGMPAVSAPSRGWTPVDCSMARGRLGCMTPLGRSFNVEAPLSFPQRLDPYGERSSSSHYYNVADGPVPFSHQELEQGLIDVPTPGPRDLVRAATPEGTLNEATPEPYYSLELRRRGLSHGALVNPVKSFLTTDQWGNRIIVNVTQPGHTLWPGYVARYVTSSDRGSTIQNEGEGLGFWQGPPGERLGIADDLNSVWRGQANEIMKRRK